MCFLVDIPFTMTGSRHVGCPMNCVTIFLPKKITQFLVKIVDFHQKLRYSSPLNRGVLGRDRPNLLPGGIRGTLLNRGECAARIWRFRGYFFTTSKTWAFWKKWSQNQLIQRPPKIKQNHRETTDEKKQNNETTARRPNAYKEKRNHRCHRYQCKFPKGGSPSVCCKIWPPNIFLK